MDGAFDEAWMLLKEDWATPHWEGDIGEKFNARLKQKFADIAEQKGRNPRGISDMELRREQSILRHFEKLYGADSPEVQRQRAYLNPNDEPVPSDEDRYPDHPEKPDPYKKIKPYRAPRPPLPSPDPKVPPWEQGSPYPQHPPEDNRPSPYGPMVPPPEDDEPTPVEKSFNFLKALPEQQMYTQRPMHNLAQSPEYDPEGEWGNAYAARPEGTVHPAIAGLLARREGDIPTYPPGTTESSILGMLGAGSEDLNVHGQHDFGPEELDELRGRVPDLRVKRGARTHGDIERVSSLHDPDSSPVSGYENMYGTMPWPESQIPVENPTRVASRAPSDYSAMHNPTRIMEKSFSFLKARLILKNWQQRMTGSDMRLDELAQMPPELQHQIVQGMLESGELDPDMAHRLLAGSGAPPPFESEEEAAQPPAPPPAKREEPPNPYEREEPPNPYEQPAASRRPHEKPIDMPVD